jgi:hypothetical protein
MSEVAVREMSPPESIPTFIDTPPERRRGVRVPAAGPVRVGPPHREPHARLSATDLSAGGMFIDADRPVRVGARFCAEIVLSDGQHVYVPEAEVAYNRDRPHGSGFGVRFLEISQDAQRQLEEEILRLSQDLEVEVDEEPYLGLAIDTREPSASIPPLASEAPTAAETPKATLPVPSAVPAPKPRRDVGRWLQREVRGMAAQLPSLWLVLAGMGAALLVVAVGLVLWAEISSAPRIEVRPVTSAGEVAGGALHLSSATHERLMGRGEPETLPPLAPLERKPAASAAATPEPKPRARRPHRPRAGPISDPGCGAAERDRDRAAPRVGAGRSRAAPRGGQRAAHVSAEAPGPLRCRRGRAERGAGRRGPGRLAHRARSLRPPRRVRPAGVRPDRIDGAPHASP